MLPGFSAPLLFNSSGPNIANLFASTPYSGAAAATTITSGIDVSTRGGLVWIKRRDAIRSHSLFDTARGVTKSIRTNTNAAQTTDTDQLTAFTTSGFSLDADAGKSEVNFGTPVAWSFARAARFFDVVTWTGDATNRTIAHSLGVVPGAIIVKRTDTTGDWQVYHREVANTNYLVLNSTAASASGTTRWNSTTATDSVFSIGTDATVNASLGTYVAYVFAHDTAADGVVQCGIYTGNGASGGPTVTLGWQPQWLMLKRTNSTGDWWIYDSARSTTNPRTDKLLANSSAAQDTAGEDVDFNSTGFQIKSTAASINTSGGTYVYVAIRAA